MMGKCSIEQEGEAEILVSRAGGHWHLPDWAEYKYIDFGTSDGAPISSFFVLARGKGRITLKVDGGEEISSIDIDSDIPKYTSAHCKNISGVHTLWLFLEGDLKIEEFFFE
jgi:hypothetical protein